MAVGCGFTACKYMIVRTIRLNKALFYVLLTMILTFIHSFTHLFMFPVVVSKKKKMMSLTYVLINCLNEN